jgi:hypothetical protein
MRCLYCGKQLALFRRLTGGGEFCSDAHKASYQDEFNRLALARLKQAQEKSDELRAAIPQNQLALSRRGPGDPEGPTIRSNAHWIEPKPGRGQQRKTLAIAAPEGQVQPDPKESDFIKELPSPAQPSPLGAHAVEPHPAEVAVAAQNPEWTPPVAPAAVDPVEGGLVPSTALPEAARPAPANFDAIAPEAISSVVTTTKPDWNPPLAHMEVPAASHVESPPPIPHEHPVGTDIPAPPVSEMPMPPRSLPPVAPPQSVAPTYPSLPRIEIDSLRFAPGFTAEVEMRSQFLPFHFDFTAFPAPDLDILESTGTPAPRLKDRPRATLKRTEQEHVLDPPVSPMQPVRRRSATPAQALEMGMIGEIAALANPVTSLYPRSATPSETKPTEAPVEADALLPQPPAVVMPRSVIGFRATEKAAPVAVSDEQDDKRPSTLKVKLAAMANAMPPPAPAAESPKPPGRQTVPPNRIPERKPVERSTVQPQPARIMSTPRRRTVPVPSILELPQDPGEEQKSLWGALRRYLGK